MFDYYNSFKEQTARLYAVLDTKDPETIKKCRAWRKEITDILDKDDRLRFFKSHFLKIVRLISYFSYEVVNYSEDTLPAPYHNAVREVVRAVADVFETCDPTKYTFDNIKRTSCFLHALWSDNARRLTLTQMDRLEGIADSAVNLALAS